MESKLLQSSIALESIKMENDAYTRRIQEIINDIDELLDEINKDNEYPAEWSGSRLYGTNRT